MNKKTIALIAGVLFLLGSGSAAAAPGDWQMFYRNLDDTEYVPMYVPYAATSTYRFLGGGLGTDEGRWYYLGDGLRGDAYIPEDGYPGYKISLDVGSSPDINSIYSALDGLSAQLVGTVSTTTYDAGVSSLQSGITSINSVIAQMNANLYGTSTSMTVGNASTTSGLVTKADKAKWDSMAQVQSDWTQASTTAPDYIRNKPTLASVAVTGSYLDLSNRPGTTTVMTLTTTGTGGAATYATSTNTLNVPNYTPAARSFANSTRTLNSAFQVSSTRDAFVSYSVDISASLSLTGGQTGTAYLEYADDSGFTTNVVTVQSAANGNTGTLTVGLALTQTATASLTGQVPAGKYVRIRTANTTGTPSFTYRAGQEVLQ